MTVALISAKGQIVIPRDIRRAAGLEAGHTVSVAYSPETKAVTLRKPRTLGELAAAFTPLIKPGTPPLADADSVYATREPRL